MTIDNNPPPPSNDRPDAPRAVELPADKTAMNRPTGPSLPSQAAPSGRMPLFGR